MLLLWENKQAHNNIYTGLKKMHKGQKSPVHFIQEWDRTYQWKHHTC